MCTFTTVSPMGIYFNFNSNFYSSSFVIRNCIFGKFIYRFDVLSPRATNQKLHSFMKTPIKQVTVCSQVIHDGI
jgi:hypothetical protein